MLTTTQCTATTEHDIWEQTFPQIQVHTIDRINDYLVNSGVLLTDQLGIK